MEKYQVQPENVKNQMQIDRGYVDFGIIIGSRIFFEKMQDTQFDNNFSTQTRKLVPQNSVINLQDLTQ